MFAPMASNARASDGLTMDARAQIHEGEVVAVGPGRRTMNGDVVPVGARETRDATREMRSF